jgi:hypothetical protein
MSAETTPANPADTAPALPDAVFLTPSAKQAWIIYQKEIATYRRELPRLLAQGQANRYALIKGDYILNIWETCGEAVQAGRERFGLEPIFVTKIDQRDLERFALFDARIAACQASQTP